MLFPQKNGKITKLRDYAAKGRELGDIKQKQHSVSLLRSAMLVYHKLKMIKQNTKMQAEAHLLDTEW